MPYLYRYIVSILTVPDRDLNYLDKKSMYIGLYKTANKALSCLVLIRGMRGAGGGVQVIQTPRLGLVSKKLFRFGLKIRGPAPPPPPPAPKAPSLDPHRLSWPVSMPFLADVFS